MPIDLDEYRKASEDNWNRIAGNWDRRREYIWSATHGVSERVVDEADPQPGDTVLDIAAGTGDTGHLAAERIGSEGKLISTDFAAAMVDVAKGVADEKGLENVEHRVLDAEKMDLDDDSIDRVLCRFGYMLMADPATALAETRRVLKDDGRLSFAVWAAPDQNLWAYIPGAEMVQRGHLPPPEPGMPGIFALGERARLEELVAEAGFESFEIAEVALEWPYVDADEHWTLTNELAGPLADAIAQLEADERESLRLAVRSKVEPLLADGSGVNGLTYVVTAS